MSVTRSSLVTVGSSASKDELWAQAGQLVAQWDGGIAITTEWRTRIERARNDGETRTGLVTKPLRSISQRALSLDLGDSALMGGIVRRMASARTPVPLWCDATRVRVTASIGATTLQVDDARWRRFQSGGWALAGRYVREGTPHARLDAYELLQVGEVGDDALAVAATTRQWAAGDVIVPVIEGRLNLEGTARNVTGDCADWTIAVDETEGASALDPLATPGGDPPGILGELAMCGGYPVFPFGDRVQWSGGIEDGIFRHGTYGGAGSGKVVDLEGSRPLVRFTLPLEFYDRERAWQWLTWVDWRGGPLYPFIVAHPAQRLPEVVEILGDSSIGLRRNVLPDDDWPGLKFIAVHTKAGAEVVLPVTGVVHSGGVTTVSVDGEWGFEFEDVAWATSAHLMRFDQDASGEQWETTEVMTTEARLVEIDAEGELTIENLDTPATGTVGP